MLFTFYIQGVLKFKKNNSGAKRVTFASEDGIRDSVLAVVTVDSGTDNRRIAFSYRETPEIFFPSPKRLGRHCEPSQPITERTLWGFPEIKRPGLETDYHRRVPS